jgi:integrase
MSRRANGEGTVYQRSDGRYAASAYVPTRSGRKRRTVYGRTREEAAGKLADLLAAGRRGVPVAEKGWTVERYLAYWLAEVVEQERRPATVSAYRTIVERYIVPRIGRIRLDALGTQDVRRLLNSCRDATVQVGRVEARPVSTRTVQMVHAVLRNAIEHAVREELVPRNVVKLVRVPAPHYEVGTGLSLAQARRLLVAVQGDRLRAVYVLALSVGLRRGELLGLRWADVDLDGGELRVRQAVQRVAGELRFTEPKTRRSRRTLPLPALAVDALREHRARQASERLASGPAWQDSGLIFTTARGTPIEPRNLNRHWYALRDRVGLPGVRLHDLRHTCVTLLLDDGAPPHIVQAIAGHSGIQVTMTIYAHAAQEEQRKVLGSLGERLR